MAKTYSAGRMANETSDVRPPTRHAPHHLLVAVQKRSRSFYNRPSVGIVPKPLSKAKARVQCHIGNVQGRSPHDPRIEYPARPIKGLLAMFVAPFKNVAEPPPEVHARQGVSAPARHVCGPGHSPICQQQSLRSSRRSSLHRDRIRSTLDCGLGPPGLSRAVALGHRCHHASPSHKTPGRIPAKTKCRCSSEVLLEPSASPRHHHTPRQTCNHWHFMLRLRLRGEHCPRCGKGDVRSQTGIHQDFSCIFRRVKPSHEVVDPTANCRIGTQGAKDLYRRAAFAPAGNGHC